MSIIGQAQLELERVNFGEGDTAVMLGILRTFFGQWDSGGAVSVASEVLSRLIAGQPLTPLTGEPDEWYDPIGDGHLLQNMRCGTVFKERDGKCYDIGAPGSDEVPVEFPYNPVTRSVEMPIYEVTADDLVRAGVDRGDAEFVHGEQWPADTVKSLLGCTICGAMVADPCRSIEKANNCDLPPGTTFVVGTGQSAPVRMVGRRVLGVTEYAHPY